MKSQNLKNQFDFIIFGSGNYNSLGVLHSMIGSNARIFILCVGCSKHLKQGNIIGYSRFAKDLKEVSSVEKGVDWLIKNSNLFSKQAIIYPTGDCEVKELDRNVDKLKNHYIFPTCINYSDISRLMDKNIQITQAEKYGLKILKTQFSNSPKFSFKDVIYPCMVKPLNSTLGSKGDMRICHNETELNDALVSSKLTKNFLVQQYIKNEADLLFLGISLPNGNVLLPALVRKPGVSPTGEYSHAIITTDIDKYLPDKESVISFVKSLNYTGPFSIEFGLENGKIYFFEINLRNDGTAHYPLGLGVNIPLIYYNSIHNRKYPSSWKIGEYEMIDESRDLRRVFSKEISLVEWCRSLINAGSYKFYNKYDKRLLYPLVLMFINIIYSKIFRTKIN